MVVGNQKWLCWDFRICHSWCRLDHTKVINIQKILSISGRRFKTSLSLYPVTVTLSLLPNVQIIICVGEVLIWSMMVMVTHSQNSLFPRPRRTAVQAYMEICCLRWKDSTLLKAFVFNIFNNVKAHPSMLQPCATEKVFCWCSKYLLSSWFLRWTSTHWISKHAFKALNLKLLQCSSSVDVSLNMQSLV